MEARVRKVGRRINRAVFCWRLVGRMMKSEILIILFSEVEGECLILDKDGYQ